MNEALVSTITAGMHAFVCQCPELLLASAGVWADPLVTYFPDGDWRDDPDHENSNLLCGWGVSRDLWPDVYADMNLLVWEGTPTGVIERITTETVITKLPGANSDGRFSELADLIWGIPLPYYGVGIGDEDGINEGSIAYDWADILTLTDADLPDVGVYEMMNILQRSTPVDSDLNLFFRWLNSTTGNSSMDYSYEEAGDNGIGWMELDSSNLTLGWEIVDEADEMMDQIVRAAEYLESTDEAVREYCENAVIALCAGLEEVFHVRTPEHRPLLGWACDVGQGHHSETPADDPIHAVWHLDAA